MTTETNTRIATESALGEIHWDADLNAYREADGKVMGSKCGLLTADGEAGGVTLTELGEHFVDITRAGG